MQQKTDAQLHSLNATQNLSTNTLEQPSQYLYVNQQKRFSDAEDNGGRSDDWCSETSSGNFAQIRQPIIKGRTFISANKHRKFSITPSSSVSVLTSTGSKDNNTNNLLKNPIDSSNFNGSEISNDDANKKPLIAKWKTGVRLQNASSTASPDSKGIV